MEFPEGLGIGAVLRRGPVEDVIVTKDGTLLKDLKPGSVVGTGSLRRELQIKKINPLIRVKLIRGNVQTRLRKLEEGQYDAIVLAAAGLDRLELSDENQWKFEHLSSEVCLPAAGQAILAVESRNGDLREVLNAIHDKCAWVELCAERAFLKAIGGSCNAPAAGLAHLDENGLLPVELRHNPGADLQINSYWGVVSFTLSSIPQYQDSAFKGFRILYKIKEGDDIHTVTLHK
jgi:uroporphyrinogen III methyltransferase/synthase